MAGLRSPQLIEGGEHAPFLKGGTGGLSRTEIESFTSVTVPPPTGVNDTVALRAALTSLEGKPGRVLLRAGTYISERLVLASGQVIVGQGPGVTTLLNKNEANDILLESERFSELTGGNTFENTPNNFGFENITLDGGKANQTGHEGGPSKHAHVVAFYGYGFRINNFVIRNGTEVGLWMEWSTHSPSLEPDSMETLINHGKIHNCAGVEKLSVKEGAGETSGAAIVCMGPHDSQINNLVCYANGKGIGKGQQCIDFPVDGYANGSVLDLTHVYGGTYDYGVRLISSGITLTPSVQLEGAGIAQVLVGTSINRISGKFFAGGVNFTAKGIVIAAGVNNVTVYGPAKVEQLEGGVIDLTGAGGDHWIEIDAQYYGGHKAPAEPVKGAITGESNTVFITVIEESGEVAAGSQVRLPATLTVLGNIRASKVFQPAKPAKPAEKGTTPQEESHLARMNAIAITGDGVKTAWKVKHSLTTRLVQVAVQKAEGEEPGELVELPTYKAKAIGAGEVEVTFTIAPGAGVLLFITVVG